MPRRRLQRSEQGLEDQAGQARSRKNQARTQVRHKRSTENARSSLEQAQSSSRTQPNAAADSAQDDYTVEERVGDASVRRQTRISFPVVSSRSGDSSVFARHATQDDAVRQAHLQRRQSEPSSDLESSRSDARPHGATSSPGTHNPLQPDDVSISLATNLAGTTLTDRVVTEVAVRQVGDSASPAAAKSSTSTRRSRPPSSRSGVSRQPGQRSITSFLTDERPSRERTAPSSLASTALPTTRLQEEEAQELDWANTASPGQQDLTDWHSSAPQSTPSGTEGSAFRQFHSPRDDHASLDGASEQVVGTTYTIHQLPPGNAQQRRSHRSASESDESSPSREQWVVQAVPQVTAARLSDQLDSSESEPETGGAAARGDARGIRLDRQADSSSRSADYTPASSAFAQQKVIDSARFVGCTCSGEARQRTLTQATEGDDMLNFTRRWQHELQIPDVLEEVSAAQAPVTFTPEEAARAPWTAILAGMPTRRDGEVGTDDLTQRRQLSLERSCLLRRERPRDVRVERTWDIDAFILPIRSLAAFDSGINFSYLPRVTKTIDKSWHIPVPGLGVRPDECKHLRLGQPTAAAAFDIFIFFPNLPVGPKNKYNKAQSAAQRINARCYLNSGEQQEWIDSVLMPSLRDVYPDDVLQHHPRSFAEARDRSRARQKETVTTKDRAFAEYFYTLPNTDGSALSSLWAHVETRLQRLDPRWHGAVLIAQTYGCKLSYRSESISTLRQSVLHYLQHTFDLGMIDMDRAFVDLAYEDIAYKASGSDDPLVCLWRTSCHEADVRQLGLTGAQYFNWQFTADVTSSRVEPGKTSLHRAGGLAYIQSYNLIKDAFTCPDRKATAAFGDPAFRSLAYTDAALSDFQKINRPGCVDPHTRRRALKAFTAVVSRTRNAIQVNASSKTPFGVRQEYRINWRLFVDLQPPSSQPSIDDGAHRPFYVLRKTHVFNFIRAEVNRWLFAIYAVQSAVRWQGVGGAMRDALADQHARAAMLNALMHCLEIAISDGCIAQFSRLGQSEYKKIKDNKPNQARAQRVWTAAPVHVGGGLVDLGNPEGSDAEDGSDVTEHSSDTQAGGTRLSTRYRRGLGLIETMCKTNRPWLPLELFSWDRLRFKADRICLTSFVTKDYREKYARSDKLSREDLFRDFVDKQLRTVSEVQARSWPDGSSREVNTVIESLYQLVFFRFANYLLAHLAKTSHLDCINLALNVGERSGHYGLSYDLVRRATGCAPVISEARARGGNNSAPGGFSDFENTWETRVKLLFSWDDGFKRPVWENGPWREWTRYIHSSMQYHWGGDIADRWLDHVGEYGRRYLTILPKYEGDKLYQVQKAPRNISKALQEQRKERKHLKWVAAQPLEWRDMIKGRVRATANYRRDDWLLITDQSGVPRNGLELVYEMYPSLLKGKPFTLISDVIGKVEDDDSDPSNRDEPPPSGRQSPDSIASDEHDTSDAAERTPIPRPRTPAQSANVGRALIRHASRHAQSWAQGRSQNVVPAERRVDFVRLVPMVGNARPLQDVRSRHVNQAADAPFHALSAGESVHQLPQSARSRQRPRESIFSRFARPATPTKPTDTAHYSHSPMDNHVERSSVPRTFVTQLERGASPLPASAQHPVCETVVRGPHASIRAAEHPMEETRSLPKRQRPQSGGSDVRNGRLLTDFMSAHRAGAAARAAKRTARQDEAAIDLMRGQRWAE